MMGVNFMSEFSEIIAEIFLYSMYVVPILQLIAIIYTSIKKKWALSYKIQGALVAYVILGCLILANNLGMAMIFSIFAFVAMIVLFVISLIIHGIVKAKSSGKTPVVLYIITAIIAFVFLLRLIDLIL